jgi:signal transduction histidine kinase
VSDDGNGLNGVTVAGVGMTSIRERAEELGGSVVWTAEPAGGTRLIAVLPR